MRPGSGKWKECAGERGGSCSGGERTAARKPSANDFPRSADAFDHDLRQCQQPFEQRWQLWWGHQETDLLGYLWRFPVAHQSGWESSLRHSYRGGADDPEHVHRAFKRPCGGGGEACRAPDVRTSPVRSLWGWYGVCAGGRETDGPGDCQYGG